MTWSTPYGGNNISAYALEINSSSGWVPLTLCPMQNLNNQCNISITQLSSSYGISDSGNDLRVRVRASN